MEAVSDLNTIEKSESIIEEAHIVILLLIKPSDSLSDEYYNNLNYWHYSSEKKCSIYLVGHLENKCDIYKDLKEVKGIDSRSFWYSDKCFIDTLEQLSKRLKNWTYSGEPELMVLQKGVNQNKFDFRNYCYLDINYGLKNGYIDSMPRFMERLLNACKSEVTIKGLMNKELRKRFSPKTVLEMAIKNTPKLPKSIKTIINDRLFFKISK